MRLIVEGPKPKAKPEWPPRWATFESVEELEAADRNGDDERSDRRQAVEWLRDELAGGPMKSTDVLREAKQNGIAEKTLRRAYHDMGGKPFKESFEGHWYWALPGEDGQDTPEDSQGAHSPGKGILGQGGHLGAGDTADETEWGEL